VTPAKDQGLCASGWSFAATAALESSLLISQNTPGSTLDLSEQALIACSGAGGCQGGWLNTASEFLRSVGLPAEGCYPYTATDGLCSNACADWPGSSSRISNWFNVSPTVQSLKYALYNFGPVVALMEIRTDFLF
jgi:C1A family cysteine protease